VDRWLVAFHRVEEVADATATRVAYRSEALRDHDGQVMPLMHGGVEDRGLAAAVEQVQQVVGGQRAVAGIERTQLGRRHRRLEIVRPGGVAAGMVRPEPDQRAEASGRQAHGGL
jgi:hypothetical protein